MPSNKVLNEVKIANLKRVKALIGKDIDKHFIHEAIIDTIIEYTEFKHDIKLAEILRHLKNNHLLKVTSGTARKYIEEIRTNATEWLPKGTFLIAGRTGYKLSDCPKEIRKYADTMLVRAMLSSQLQLQNAELQIGKELLI